MHYIVRRTEKPPNLGLTIEMVHAVQDLEAYKVLEELVLSCHSPISLFIETSNNAQSNFAPRVSS